MQSLTQSPPSAARRFDAVCRILDSFGRDATRLIPILQAVQNEYRYLPEEVMVFIATSLGIPPAQVYGVATFYSHFALEPKGKHVIRLCDGTACHVKGSIPILEAVRARLSLTEKKNTTSRKSMTPVRMAWKCARKLSEARVDRSAPGRMPLSTSLISGRPEIVNKNEMSAASTNAMT